MPHEQSASIIYTVIIFVISIASVYFNFKGKIQDAENRMATLENELKHVIKQVDSNVVRLNDHEAQQKLLISLTEQVKNLTEDMGELKSDIKSLLKK